MEGESDEYRKQLREHFVGQLKNSKLPNVAQQYQEYSHAQSQQKRQNLQNMQKMQNLQNMQNLQDLQDLQDLEASYQRRRQHHSRHHRNGQQPQHRHSGGDADRLLFANTSISDSCRTSQTSEGLNSCRMSQVSDGPSSYRTNHGNDINSTYRGYSTACHRGHAGAACKEYCDMERPYIQMQQKRRQYQEKRQSNPKATVGTGASGFLYEHDYNIGHGCGASVRSHKSAKSTKSTKSTKTVMTKSSSRELRKRVRSQCKLQEVIDDTIKQMDTEMATKKQQRGFLDGRFVPPTRATPATVLRPAPKAAVAAAAAAAAAAPKKVLCNRCSATAVGHGTTLRNSRSVAIGIGTSDGAGDSHGGATRRVTSSHKDVTTEIACGDFADIPAKDDDPMIVSVDDVVNSRVVNPMIRKLQRMYLNNLKEEMSLMEDLERLPRRVNEVYKATVL